MFLIADTCCLLPFPSFTKGTRFAITRVSYHSSFSSADRTEGRLGKRLMEKDLEKNKSGSQNKPAKQRSNTKAAQVHVTRRPSKLNNAHEQVPKGWFLKLKVRNRWQCSTMKVNMKSGVCLSSTPLKHGLSNHWLWLSPLLCLIVSRRFECCCPILYYATSQLHHLNLSDSGPRALNRRKQRHAKS